MQVEIIERFEDLERLRDDWEATYASDPEGHFFLTWIWISNWLGKLAFPWVVLAAKHDDGKYVAFLPLQIRAEIEDQSGFHNSVRMAGSYFAVYTGLLCRPGHEQDAIPALARQIKAMNWRHLHLDDLFVSAERRSIFLDQFDTDDFTADNIVRKPHITDSGEDIDHELFVHVELLDDWEAYLNTQLGRLARRNARLYLRKIDEGEAYRVTLADASTIERDLNSLLRYWLDRWEAKNPGYARGVLNNCRAMLPALFRDRRLLVPVLWHGDVPIGVHLNFIDKDKCTLHCFLAGRDPVASKVPPGFALHVFTMRWAIANGFTSYDLGTGNYGYKYSFGSTDRLIEGIKISTRSGRNLGGKLDRRTLSAVLSWSQRLQKDGKADLAAMGCRQILDADKDHADAMALLERIEAETPLEVAKGVQLHKSGQLVQAARIYTAVLAKNPRHFDANYMMGVACLQKREFNAAATYLERATEVRPQHSAAHNNLGNAMRALGRYEAAARCYEVAVARKPDFAEAHNNLGLAMQELGRLNEAKAHFEKALSIRPDYS